MFIFLIVVMSHSQNVFVHFKLHTSNMCSLWCVKNISMKLFEEIVVKVKWEKKTEGEKG